MKRVYIFIFLFVIVCLDLSFCSEYERGDVLLKFKPAITHLIIDQINNDKILEIGASKVSQLSNRCNVKIPEVKKILKEIGILHLKFSPDIDIRDIIEKYKLDFEVEYAEPNYIRHAFATIPNDGGYGHQCLWELHGEKQVFFLPFLLPLFQIFYVLC